MILLHLTKANISNQAISQWCDFLLMADAMGRPIALALDKDALPLMYPNGSLAKRFKALSYTDLERVLIGAQSCDDKILLQLSEAGIEYDLCNESVFLNALAKSDCVIAL